MASDKMKAPKVGMYVTMDRARNARIGGAKNPSGHTIPDGRHRISQVIDTFTSLGEEERIYCRIRLEGKVGYCYLWEVSMTGESIKDLEEVRKYHERAAQEIGVKIALIKQLGIKNYDDRFLNILAVVAEGKDVTKEHIATAKKLKEALE